METRDTNIALLTTAFVIFVAGTGSALKCYDCGWSANKYEPKRPLSSTEEPPSYPVAETVVGNKTHPPNKNMMEKQCVKETCRDRDPACMKWSFLSGSPENITFMCVGNPGNRKGCYKIDVPHGDKEKKYNTKTLKVEVCLCSDKDFCNTSGQNSSIAILVMAMAISVLLGYKALLSYR